MPLPPRLAALREKLEPIALKSWFRITVAGLLLFFHLGMFTAAGRARLDLPFNSAPTHVPYYSDPDAPSLGGYPRQPHYWSRLIVSRWDAQHYIGFAVRGLTACPTSPEPGTEMQYVQCGMTWFPAYGEVGGLIVDTTGAPADFALLFISLLATMIINVLWTSKALTDRLGTLETYASLLAFNFFPSAFHLVCPYTESTTIALTLAGFLMITQQRWLLAGLLIGAATGVRPTGFIFGFAFGCAVLFAVWQQWREKDPKWWRPLLSLPLAGWGLIANFVVLHFAVGDAFAYFHAGAFRAKVTQVNGGFHVGRLFDPEWYVTGFGAQHYDMVSVVAGFGFMILAVREVLRRFKPAEAAYLIVATALAILIPLMTETEPQYWGINRYLLVAPLIFYSLGVIARRQPLLYLGWIVVALALYWHVELCSYIAQGDPRVCPCLGRIEAAYPF